MESLIQMLIPVVSQIRDTDLCDFLCSPFQLVQDWQKGSVTL